MWLLVPMYLFSTFYPMYHLNQSSCVAMSAMDFYMSDFAVKFQEG